MIEDHLSLEDLLLATLEAGPLLTKAKGRLQHGEWGEWLHRVGLAPRTAPTWMKLAGMDLTAEDVCQGRREGVPLRCRRPAIMSG